MVEGGPYTKIDQELTFRRIGLPIRGSFLRCTNSQIDGSDGGFPESKFKKIWDLEGVHQKIGSHGLSHKVS